MPVVTMIRDIRKALRIGGRRTNRRHCYGIKVTGCSGTEIYYYTDRKVADKVRRVIRRWIAEGGWSGWWTLCKVAEYAANTPNIRSTRICVRDCQLIRQQLREKGD